MESDVVGEVQRIASVGAGDILAAQARLRRYLPPTPLHNAERFGCWLKLENLQRTGSYKVRGALNALLAARERGDHRPVIAASAGNHAQGLAWAAYRLNVPAIAVMPHGAPKNKIAGVAHWGATVRLHGDTFDEARTFAMQLADRNGYRFLSAFDDPDVIAGQGTVGMEIASLAPDVVLVPIGGGGLAAGVALALHAQAELARLKIAVRVVSMPSTSVFDRQSVNYKTAVLPAGLPRVAVEAGVTDGWWKYGCAAVIGLDRFGESAPAPLLFKHFNFTVQNVVDTVRTVLGR